MEDLIPVTETSLGGYVNVGLAGRRRVGNLRPGKLVCRPLVLGAGTKEWLGLSLGPLSFLAVAEVDSLIVVALAFEGAP